MAVVSFVGSADVARARRFDAQFFSPEFLRMEPVLASVSSEPLSVLCKVSDGNHGSISEHFGDSAKIGPRYLRGQDIGDFFLGDENAVFIPDRIFDRLSRSHIQPGDVLLSIVGTVGALSLVPEDTDRLTGSCKIAILRPRTGRIAPEYLAAFLASKYGQLQIHRWKRGAVQTGFILEDSRFVRIARLGSFEDAVSKLVRSSYEARIRSKRLYREAARIFETAMGIRQPDLSNQVGYHASLSALLRSHRWDSEFYKPKYQRVTDCVLAAKKGKTLGLAPIGRVFSFLTNGHTPKRHDLSVGEVPFLTAEHVSDFRINFGTHKRILQRHHTGELGRTALANGDVLVTIKGKVGNCAIVRNCPAKANINQDVALIRLRANVHPYFVAAWFNSIVGKEFVEQWSTGGINPFLGLGNLKRMPFPVVADRDQGRIGASVQEAAEAAQEAEAESDRLLEEATYSVESCIEKEVAK